MVKYQFLDRIPCIEGTPGVEIFPFAQDEPGEFLIYKQSFDGFHKPALPSILGYGGATLVGGIVSFLAVCVMWVTGVI